MGTTPTISCSTIISIAIPLFSQDVTLSLFCLD